eukprot:TRINITY_DN15500_c0_g1_i1.p1 TRINITY_DN15500_c0_g1~~TRINITY_DN15500_c0_g1_i1.p1  ORF type:complete len:212 (+),score=42.06 TRINITY_DN15500_c0_g1_i1:54-689(+)
MALAVAGVDDRGPGTAPAWKLENCWSSPPVDSSLVAASPARPFTAGIPLSAISPRGKLVSPLHPETNPAFHYTRKRQEYGIPGTRFAKHIGEQPVKGLGPQQIKDEARKSWFKAYAADCQSGAKTARARTGNSRVMGSNEFFGHNIESDNGWVWQSHRGWTATSRQRHEEQMKQKWLDEARQNWRSQAFVRVRTPITDLHRGEVQEDKASA